MADILVPSTALWDFRAGDFPWKPRGPRPQIVANRWRLGEGTTTCRWCHWMALINIQVLSLLVLGNMGFQLSGIQH